MILILINKGVIKKVNNAINKIKTLKLNCTQAYKVVQLFLDKIYFTTYDDELGGFLGGAALYSTSQDQAPQTMDQAIWDDWMNSVKKVCNNDAITYTFAQLSVDQAYACMHQYFVTYCDIGSGPSLKAIRDLTQDGIEKTKITAWLLNYWYQSVEHILNEDSSKQIKHIINAQTILTNRSSFLILQIFLDILCQLHYNNDLIRLVKKILLQERNNDKDGASYTIESSIWDVWLQSINTVLNQEKKHEITLLVTYKAISIFLYTYTESYPSDSIINLATALHIQDETQPQLSLHWRTLTSAVIVLYEQSFTKLHDLVSITMPTEEAKAFEILQVWLQEYKKIFSLDFIEKIILNELDCVAQWHEIVQIIKNNQRSYLLSKNELTILETYQSIIALLQKYDQMRPELAVDQQGKPLNFYILLNWIRICEKVM